ncbi:MAG: Tm-1-like ATP-binding domain-containing protein [Verrucomicrobiota bacterium]
MATIAVLGTLDTKGEEHAFVAGLIRENGDTPLLMDVGILEAPKVKPDISREEILRFAKIDLTEILKRKDRGEAVLAMTKAAPGFVAQLVEQKKIDGIISLGGSGGTAIGTAVMRALPMGFPKVMVSTVAAAGNTSQYIGVKDIVMIPSIVDVSGLNRISRQIFTRAAGAICGMVRFGVPSLDGSGDRLKAELQLDKPIIVASMFGNTTACVEHARKLLEAHGYEVLVFHATGTGGKTMESLIESGMVTGVLDITTTEWADELVGGMLGAGPTRLEAAARKGVPAIVAPGCLDMVNFSSPESIPAKFAGRNFYLHNPQVTLMRTTPEECAQLGKILAEKVNLSLAPVTVLIPKRAISVISAPGQKFYDAAADEALFSAIKTNLRSDIERIEMDCAINETVFAEACVKALLENINFSKKK